MSLAIPLQRHGVPILGTSPDSIDLAEDRRRFGGLLHELGIPAPDWGTATSIDEAREVARRIGFPVLVRPSYVLGGRAMFIAHDDAALAQCMARAVEASPEHPVLIDRFLEDAYEMDVDAVADGEQVVIGAIMQHIEEAGIHSGDSACVIPPYHPEVTSRLEQVREYTRRLALALSVRGLVNVQYAIKDGVVYVLEVNPRASRTVPFVSKATGVPLAKVAARVMVGRSLRELGFSEEPKVEGVFVKESVLPFVKFPGEDPVLGPEMKSTGEVMGISDTFGNAFAKAQIAAGSPLPLSGTVFLSVNDFDKRNLVPIARGLAGLGFRLVATQGTAEALRAAGLTVETVFKVNEGRPNVVDRLVNGEIHLIINTPLGQESYFDEPAIRRTATQHGVPLITTLSGAAAAVKGIESLQRDGLEVRTLQEIHAATPSGSGSRPVASRPGSLSSAGPSTSSGSRPTSSAGPPASSDSANADA